MNIEYRDSWLWIGKTPIACVLKEEIGHAIAAQSALATELRKLPSTDASGIRLLQQMAAETEERLTISE